MTDLSYQGADEIDVTQTFFTQGSFEMFWGVLLQFQVQVGRYKQVQVTQGSFKNDVTQFQVH